VTGKGMGTGGRMDGRTVIAECEMRRQDGRNIPTRAGHYQLTGRIRDGVGRRSSM